MHRAPAPVATDRAAQKLAMLVFRSPASGRLVADPGVRRLVDLRVAQVCAGEEYDPDRHGYAIVVEPGDRADELERESGCALLHDVFGEVRFGDPGFVPAADSPSFSRPPGRDGERDTFHHACERLCHTSAVRGIAAASCY